MSQYQKLQDGTVAPAIETLTGNAGGAISPDAAFNINLLGGNNITSTGVANTITFNLTGTTNHALQLGNATGSLTSLLLTNGQLAIGSTGADPVAATLTQPAAGFTITGGAGSITFALNDDLAAVEGIATVGLVSRTAANTWTATPITQNAILYGAAGQLPANLGPLTNGQLVIGSTGAAPLAATLTAGGGIAITNAAGSITVATVGGGLAWSNIGASGNLVVNTGVNCTAGAALSLALPAASTVGDVIRVVLDGSTSWTITQAANQQIRIGSVTTTLGAGGSLASTAQGDAIELVCKTANLIWTATSLIGNLTVV